MRPIPLHSPNPRIRPTWPILMLACLSLAISLPSFAFQIRGDLSDSLVAGANLLENPGFEIGTLAPFTGAARGTLTITDNPLHVHGGAYAMEHLATDINSSSQPWNGTNPSEFHDDTTYRFSVWVKADQPNTNVRIFIFSHQETTLASPVLTDQVFTIGTEWEQVSITHYSPPGYPRVAVRVDNRTSGHTVYWDDLALVPINNRFSNPGFETQQLAFTGLNNGQLTIDSTEFHKGAASLKHVAAANNSYTLPYHGKGAQFASVDPGDVYQFSTWLKGQSVPVQLRIIALDQGGNFMSAEVGNFTAITNWKKQTIEYEMPAGAKYVSIRLNNNGGAGATVWWDDLILEKQIPEAPPKVVFTSPVPRTLESGDTAYLGNIYQRGSDHWFSFEIPGNAVNLEWFQTQGPVNIHLSAPTTTATGKVYTGLVTFSGDLPDTAAQDADRDFTLELQFEVDGECVPFFVKGTFKFLSWDMYVDGYDGFSFDFNLTGFPQDFDFDLVVVNNSFDESLFFEGDDIYPAVNQAPYGIQTIFTLPVMITPEYPFGVLEIPPGGVEYLSFTLRSSFDAESGEYSMDFIGDPLNGGSQSTNLFGFFRGGAGELDIENISVVVVSGPSVPNDGDYELPQPLQASGESISFEIINYNSAAVEIDNPDITVISEPSGAMLDFVPDGPIAGEIGPDGDRILFSGNLTYDEAMAQDGNFNVSVSFLVSDAVTGTDFIADYTFNIKGAIGSEDPCETLAKMGDPSCDGPLTVSFTNGTPISTIEPNMAGNFLLENVDFDVHNILISVKNISDSASEITGFDVAGQGFSTPGFEPVSLDPQEETELTVAFNLTNLGPGTYSGAVTLSHDNGSFLTFTLNVILRSTSGIQLFQENGTEVMLSIEESGIGNRFDFTPDGPVRFENFDTIFKEFTIKNMGSQTVTLMLDDIEIKHFKVLPEDMLEPITDESEFVFFHSFFLPPEIQPGGSVQFFLKLEKGLNAAIGDYHGNVELPFEMMVDGELVTQKFYFGIKGGLGLPPKLQVNICDFDIGCMQTGQTVSENQNPTVTILFNSRVPAKTFTLENIGERPLIMQGIYVAGYDFELYEPVPANYGSPLSTWTDKKFHVLFTPQNNDPDYVPTSQIEVVFGDANQIGPLDSLVIPIQGQAGDIEVQNQDIQLPTGGLVDFPPSPQASGGTIQEELVIRNLGNTTLNGNVIIAPIQGDAFSIAGDPPNSIQVPPGASQTVNVVLDRSTPGSFLSLILVDHNLPGPDPYTISVSGTVGNGGGGGPGNSGSIRITHGPTTPVENHSSFDFGQTPVGVFIGKNFRIWNHGTTPLVLTGANIEVPSGYQLIGRPDGPIPPPDPDGTVHWDNFSVHLTANQAGQFNGPIRITNNSGHNPDPYTINVTGSVGSQGPGPADIRVTWGGAEVPHLSLFSFGNTDEGTYIGRNFLIHNETNEPLTFPQGGFSVPAGYQLIATPGVAIQPPDPDGTVHSDNFSVHLTANNPGTFNGQISFTPHRLDGTPLEKYRINVTGSVNQDPICLSDNTPPSLTITNPADNEVLQVGTVTIGASASDNGSGVAQVIFRLNGNVIKNDSTAPYSVQWNAAVGNYTITAEAIDHCGNLRTKSIGVAVQDACAGDNQGPSISILSPADGAMLEPGLQTITSSASDVSGVERVEYYINGTLFSTETVPPYSHGHWFTVQGNQTIQAIAYDYCGNNSSDSVTFYVTESGAPCDNDNQPPTGTYTNPVNNAVIPPGPITLTANVTDNVNVLGVSFTVDGNAPEGNVDLAPPWQYTWNATPGVHTLSLGVVDVCDNFGTTGTITVTVLDYEPTAVPNFSATINGQPLGGLIVNQTNPTIDFDWDHASAPSGIDVYHIVVQPQGGPWIYGPNLGYPTNSFSLQTSNLVPGLTYSTHIRAKSNDGHWGDFVNGGTFTVQ